jgi:hypothetical protein
LGGQIFDVLGKVQFEGRSLRDLLIDAVRYGDQPEVRARLTKVVENAFDKEALRELLESRALAHDSMDAFRVYRIRYGMARPSSPGSMSRATGGGKRRCKSRFSGSTWERTSAASLSSTGKGVCPAPAHAPGRCHQARLGIALLHRGNGGLLRSTSSRSRILRDGASGPTDVARIRAPVRESAQE